jgi:AAA+ ATPase superfamily predicted ATPase
MFVGHTNPFRIHGVVRRPYFTDREREVLRIREHLGEPGSKLLVIGERRMGKSSALAVAADDARDEHGVVIFADFSTVSSVVDMSNRLLAAAAKALGKKWKDVLTQVVRGMGMSVSLSPDPITGVLLPSLELGLRQAPLAEQQESLTRVLNQLNAMAGERGVALGIVIDEFQEIRNFGAEQAEWHLRGVIQHHDHLAYVLAGSRTHLIRNMLDKGRAFYGLLDKLEFGPIEPAHLAEWIDDRMKGHGVASEAAGSRIVAIAGTRTRDIVQLARKTFDVASVGGSADERTIERAFRELVDEEDALIRSWWARLTANQQNMMRAIAAARDPLTSKATLQRFGLPSSSTVTQAMQTFMAEGTIQRGGPGGYAFDSPYMRGWVIANALPDIGMEVPVTFTPES